MEMQSLASADFPPALREIPDLPERLWLRGSLPPAGTKLLAVVGSRALSRYGKEACEMLIAGLSGYPVSIVSGLALGADACAHRAALSAGLHTIAIPGSGLDDSVIYPRAHEGLAHEILAAGGALLSEHGAKHRAAPHDFPSRNRIMAGMADAVLVVEAAPRSGTLITARLAADYNRELLALPHRISDPHGFGPHLFIRLGATLVTEPLHILEALKLPPKEREAGAAPRDLAGAELVIWDMLKEPKSRDELLRAGEDAGAVMTALVSLELRGLAKEEFGAWRRV
ncbi:MAG: DNA-processing protein DprA [Patescibacteria group bacterium]|nr:DNA-processing protein DprA [Patescibacteria group bacterium]MDE1965623.1 DNA-processing protein DprA [Patescibacteria group bacterium]